MNIIYLVAVVLFVAMVCFLIKNIRNLTVNLRILVIGIVLINSLMILPLLEDSENFVMAFFYALQMGSLDADYKELILRATQIPLFGYKIFFTVLCVLSPLVFGGAILSLFENFVNHAKCFLFYSWNDIYFFSELNNNSLMLAESIHINQKKALIIFCNCQTDSSNDIQAKARKAGFLLFKRSEINFTKRTFGHRFYFEVSNDENLNLAQTKHLISTCTDTSNLVSVSKTQIFLFSSRNEAAIALNSIDKKGLNVSLINRDMFISYELFHKYPLYLAFEKTDRTDISMLVVGAGNIGLEIIKTVLWCGQLGSEHPFKLHVIDKDAYSKEASLKTECPELLQPTYNLSFSQVDVIGSNFTEVLDADCPDANYIVVALGNDEQSLQTALYLRSYYLRRTETSNNEPLIAVLITNDIVNNFTHEFTAIDRDRINKKGWNFTSDAAQNYHLIPFGSSSSIYSYEFIVNSQIEKLALNVHATYEFMFQGKNVDNSNILRNYNANELNKQSDRANGLHIQYKLFLLGYRIKLYSEATQEEKENALTILSECCNKLKDDSVIKYLSKLEHDRWNAFMRSEGWIGASINQTKQYLPYTCGSHKNIRAKQHACICDWEQLDAVAKEFDPKFKYYDEQFIEQIPSILGMDDNTQINISGIKYILVKNT